MDRTHPQFIGARARGLTVLPRLLRAQRLDLRVNVVRVFRGLRRPKPVRNHYPIGYLDLRT
jgi:hypothetical protein